MPREMDVNSEKKSGTSEQETPLDEKGSKSITYPSCGENAVYHFQSFAENASIDGIKFLGEKGRTILERMFWSVTLTIALILCIFLVVKTYQKWINNPVIVSFATKQTSVFEIPFPSITLCPETKVRKDLLDYTGIYLNMSLNRAVKEDEKLNFEYLSLICDIGSELSNKSMITNDKEVIDFLIKAVPNWNESVLSAEWRGRDLQENPHLLFSPILTSEGICYTFNMLDRKELFTNLTFYHKSLFSNTLSSNWFPEIGYTNNADINAYPRRTTNAGSTGGINIILKISKHDLDYACGDGLQGFKVTLHNPTEVPRVRQSYFQLPVDQTVVASIKPNVMTTSEDLRSYSTRDRKCYFDTEKKLNFFKIYNQQNCLIECLAKFTLRLCGCVNFHMPREEFTPICGPVSIDCMTEANVLFLTNDTNHNRKKIKKSETSIEKCDCLPACDSLDYDVETSQSKMNWKESFKVLRQTKQWKEILKETDEESVHVVQLTVFFKDMQFLTAERNEWKGYTDFWSDVGGIIGLFTGFSFITMFEIFYYLSLRPTFNIKMFGRKFWSGAPELLKEHGIKTRLK